MTKTDMVHVPYKGGPGDDDMIAGQVQVVFSSAPRRLPQGKQQGPRIAVTTLRRSTALPELPSCGVGLPGYEADNWLDRDDRAHAGAPSSTISTWKSCARCKRRM